MFVQLRIASAIKTHGRTQNAFRQVKTQQLPVLHRTANDKAVPFADVADVLDLVLVLVRPERVDVPILVRGAQHRPGGGGPLLLRAVVLLDSDAPEPWMQ